MPLVIVDGPEAAGKTTLIDALLERWGPDSRFRGWGPRDSWLEYCQPLFDDIKACKQNPNLLIVWSRSWLSRAVYNSLLAQGQSVPKSVTKELDHIVIREGGLLVLMVSPVNTLLQRRIERLNTPGSKPDHSLDPGKELKEFYLQNSSKKWRMLSGMDSPESNVNTILNLVVARNPASKMESRLEQPIGD